MAKRPKKDKDEIAAVPVDQDIEIELSDDPIVTITDDTGKKEPPKKTNGQEPPVIQTQDDDGVDLRKQLDDLKKAEETARAQAVEWERRAREEATQRQELEQQGVQHQNQQLETAYDSILNAINAAESEANAAQAVYERAAEAGDYKGMGEAQRKISRAEARLESLEQGKSDLEMRREAAKQHVQTQRPTASTADPLEAHIANLPDLAKNWIRSHREYMEKQDKNVDLQMAHLKAVKSGITPYTQSYIDFVEEDLGLRQKKVTTEDDDTYPEPPRRAPVSAPVSREVASPSTGRSTPTKITLTAEEREIARLSMPNTDPGEAERIYAQQKLKLQQLKSQGHYRDNA